MCNGVGGKKSCCISFGGGNSPQRPTHCGPEECLRPTHEASDQQLRSPDKKTVTICLVIEAPPRHPPAPPALKSCVKLMKHQRMRNSWCDEQIRSRPQRRCRFFFVVFFFKGARRVNTSGENCLRFVTGSKRGVGGWLKRSNWTAERAPGISPRSLAQKKINPNHRRERAPCGFGGLLLAVQEKKKKKKASNS